MEYYVYYIIFYKYLSYYYCNKSFRKFKIYSKKLILLEIC